MVTQTGKDFAKALSLALPNTSIPLRAVASLARAVVDEARRGLAMDQASDPLREAMDELEEDAEPHRSERERQASRVRHVCAGRWRGSRFRVCTAARHGVLCDAFGGYERQAGRSVDLWAEARRRLAV
jgi:hypothetical protein